MALAMLGIPIYIFYIIKISKCHICVILSVDIVIINFIIAILNGEGLLKTVFWLNALKALILALSVNVGYTSHNVTTHTSLRIVPITPPVSFV